MKVIFLDIDGVLVTLKSIRESYNGKELSQKADRRCVRQLNRIIGVSRAQKFNTSDEATGFVKRLRARLKRRNIKLELIRRDVLG